MKNYILGTFLGMLLFSCTESPKADVHNPINDKFATETKTSTKSVEFGEQTSQWLNSGSSIICKTENEDAVYVCLDSKTLQKISEFGKIGHGNKEWIAPSLISAEGNSVTIADNGTRKIYDVKGGTIEEKQKLVGKELLNDAKGIAYPTIGYMSMSPKELCLKIADINNMQTLDSIKFESKDGNSSLYEFSWAYSNNKLVLANQHANQFIVCTLNGKHQITDKAYFESKEGFAEDKVYYTDVACGKNIYILSQKKVNMEDGSGVSEVEVYGFDGKPQKKYILDFIAFKMLINGNQLLLTSVADDNIHVLDLK